MRRFPAKLWVITERRNCPLFFSTSSGGEEVKGSPLVYIPHLVDMVVHLLDENERSKIL